MGRSFFGKKWHCLDSVRSGLILEHFTALVLKKIADRLHSFPSFFVVVCVESLTRTLSEESYYCTLYPTFLVETVLSKKYDNQASPFFFLTANHVLTLMLGRADGALVGVGNANVPVAKLAEDEWVTATVAWRQANTTLESGGGEEGRQASPASPPLSASRWRSARAIARRALRVGSSTTTPVASDVSEGPEGHVDQAPEVTPSSCERDPVVVFLEDPS